MNLPWARVLDGDEMIHAGDYFADMDTFWDIGWSVVSESSKIVGSFVDDENDLIPIDKAPLVWVRPTCSFKKTRADIIREVKPGECIDFEAKSTTHYASIRGSAYQIFGSDGCRFERINSRKVRMYRP